MACKLLQQLLEFLGSEMASTQPTSKNWNIWVSHVIQHEIWKIKPNVFHFIPCKDTHLAFRNLLARLLNCEWKKFPASGIFRQTKLKTISQNVIWALNNASSYEDSPNNLHKSALCSTGLHKDTNDMILPILPDFIWLPQVSHVLHKRRL